MPDLPLRPRRSRVVAIIYLHPFELALSVVLLLLGARSLAFPNPEVVAAQPTLVTYIFWVLAITGSAMILLGLFMAWRAPGIEQAGLYLSTAAWTSYMLRQVEMVDTPRGGLLLSAVLVVAVACVVRAQSISREQRARLAVIVDANNGGAHG